MVNIIALRRKAIQQMKQKATYDLNANSKMWLGYVLTAKGAHTREDGLESVGVVDPDADFTVATKEMVVREGVSAEHARSFFRSKSILSNLDVIAFRRCNSILDDDAVKTAVMKHMEKLALDPQADIVSKIQYISCIMCFQQEMISNSVISAVTVEIVAYLRAKPDTLANNAAVRRVLNKMFDCSQNTRVTMDPLVEYVTDYIATTRDPKFFRLVSILRLMYVSTENCTASATLISLACERHQLGDVCTNRIATLLRLKMFFGTSTGAVEFAAPLAPIITECLDKYKDEEIARGVAQSMRRVGPRLMKKLADDAPFVHLCDVALEILKVSKEWANSRIPITIFLDPKLERMSVDQLRNAVQAVADDDHVGLVNPQALHHILRLVSLSDKRGIDKDVSRKALLNVAELISKRDNHLSLAIFFTWLVRVRKHIKAPDAVKTAISRISDFNTINTKPVELLASLLVVLLDVPDSMRLMQRVSLVLGKTNNVPPEYAGLIIEAFTSAASMGVPGRRMTKLMRNVCIDIIKSPEKYPPREINAFLRRFPMMYKMNSKYLLENPFHVHVARNSSGVVSALYGEMAKQGPCFVEGKHTTHDGPEDDAMDHEGRLKRNSATSGLPALAAILSSRPRMWLAMRTYIAVSRYLVPGRLTRRRLRPVMAFLEVNRGYWKGVNILQLSQACSSATHKLRTAKTTRNVRRKMSSSLRPLLAYYVSIVSAAIDTDVGGLDEIENQAALWNMAASIAANESLRSIGGSTRADVRKIFIEAMKRPDFDSVSPWLLSQMYATACEMDDLDLREKLSEKLADSIETMPYNTLSSVSTTLQLVLEPRSKLMMELNSVM